MTGLTQKLALLASFNTIYVIGIFGRKLTFWATLYLLPAFLLEWNPVERLNCSRNLSIVRSFMFVLLEMYRNLFSDRPILRYAQKNID